jgi:hypothetical protein
MKKFLIIFFLIPVFVFGQNHLQFLDIPINGSIENFTKQLESKGLDKIDKNVFIGSFGEYNDAIFFVTENENSKNVSDIHVYFYYSDNFSELMNNYKKIKEVLSKKYGTKYKETNNFTEYKFESGKENLKRFNEGSYNIFCQWNLSNGLIEMGFINLLDDTYISILYRDLVNHNSKNESDF